jgi:hypothetical protein
MLISNLFKSLVFVFLTTILSSFCSTTSTGGLNFNLSSDQEAFQELARNFAKTEVIPKAAHYDKTGEFPKELLQKAWNLGLMNTHVPKVTMNSTATKKHPQMN